MTQSDHDHNGDLFARLNGRDAPDAAEEEPESSSRPVVNYAMRAPCPTCGCTDGVRRMSGQQDTVRCARCDRFCYNAPRTETGMKPRSVQSTHEAIKPQQRARIIMRANGACEACHRSDQPLHVGHWVSVADGHARGLSDAEINSDENLLALCEECNLGLGRETMPLRLVLAAVMARANGTGR